MISGFLISLILIEKKSYSSRFYFYRNRFLRIYPVYLVVAVATLFTFYWVPTLPASISFHHSLQNSTLIGGMLLIFTNIFLFFQDLIMFLGIHQGHLIFTSDFTKSDILLWKGLLIPQAWTLGLELTFYVVAPFVLRHRYRILVVLSCSAAVRVYLIYLGLGSHDPWTYRFFPAEISFFLVGALAHQVLLPFYRRRFNTLGLNRLSSFATIFAVFILLLYSYFPIRESIKSILLIGCILLFLPFFYLFQVRHKWDSKFGNLSYPIYISHMLIINIYLQEFKKFTKMTGFQIGLVVTIVSILSSMVLNKFVSDPVERLRSRYKR
jgi:peptidoglycan/LPS O-acetylase OafA/YrhL